MNEQPERLSEPEQQLETWGVAIEEVEFPPYADPGVDCYAEIHQLNDLFDVTLLMRPGLSRWHRVTFAEWAVSRIRRFAEHGAEPDGWQRRSDGGWQLWVRSVYLGDPDDGP